MFLNTFKNSFDIVHACYCNTFKNCLEIFFYYFSLKNFLRQRLDLAIPVEIGVAAYTAKHNKNKVSTKNCICKKFYGSINDI